MTLKEKIEVARERLNNAIRDNNDANIIYQLSIELDLLISNYYRKKFAFTNEAIVNK